jgi:hypothetical protein
MCRDRIPWAAKERLAGRHRASQRPLEGLTMVGFVTGLKK